MELNELNGVYCLTLGAIVLAWGIFAQRLPVPFLELSAADERVWYWVNMTGAALASLVGIWLIVT